jgi:hypothetical protein
MAGKLDMPLPVGHRHKIKDTRTEQLSYKHYSSLRTASNADQDPLADQERFIVLSSPGVIQDTPGDAPEAPNPAS